MSNLLYVSRSLLVKEPFGIVDFFDKHVYSLLERHLLKQQFLIEFLRQSQQTVGAGDQRFHQVLLVGAQVELLNFQLGLDVVGVAGDAIGGEFQAIRQGIQVVQRDVLREVVDVLVRFKVVQLRLRQLHDLLSRVVVQDPHLRRDLNVVGELVQLLVDAELLREFLDLIDVQLVLQSQHLEHGLVAVTSGDDLRDPQRFHLLVHLRAEGVSLVLRENVFVEIDEAVEVGEDLIVLGILQRITRAAS